MESIRHAIAQVSFDRIRRDVFYLAKDPLPRRTANFTIPGHDRSTLDETDAWLCAELEKAGLRVQVQECVARAYACDRTKPLHHWYAEPPSDAPEYTVRNLLAEVRGDRLPDEIIVFVAHKDSQSWIESPGALDNAVGTAAVLEIARVLARRGLRRTVRFLFCNEEHTPWTSAVAAADMRRRGDNLIAVLNLDALSGKPDEEVQAGLKTNVTAYTLPEGKRLADLMERVNDLYAIGLAQRAHQREFANDDDGSFVKAGYGMAVANIGSFPYGDAEYHMPGDVPQRVDYENVLMATRASLAAALTLDEG